MKKIFSILLIALSFCATAQKRIDASQMWVAPSGPTLYVSTTSVTAPSTVAGTAGATFSFTLSGDNLTAQGVITAPSFLEISYSSSTSFTGTLNAPQTLGNITGEPLTIYGRFKSSETAGSKSGNITVTSTSATTRTIAVSGTVTSPTAPSIVLSTSTITLPATDEGVAGSSTTFTAAGTNLTANITVTSSNSNVGLSTDNVTFTSSVTLTQASGTVATTTLYAKTLAFATAPSVTSTITASSSGATSQTATASGTVNAPSGEVVVAQFNFGSSSASAVSDWVSVFGDPDASVIAATDNRSGSTISLSTRNTAYWSSSGTPATTVNATGGETTPDSTEFYGTNFLFPAGVVASYWQFTPTPSIYSPGTNEGFLISGLPSGTYRVEILGSRLRGNVSGANRGVNFYCIDNSGSRTRWLDIKGNTRRAATFENVIPTSGEIKLHGVRDDVLNTFGAYWSGIRIVKTN